MFEEIKEKLKKQMDKIQQRREAELQKIKEEMQKALVENSKEQ